jgi:hypothetical protein
MRLRDEGDEDLIDGRLLAESRTRETAGIQVLF